MPAITTSPNTRIQHDVGGGIQKCTETQRECTHVF